MCVLFWCFAKISPYLPLGQSGRNRAPDLLVLYQNISSNLGVGISVACLSPIARVCSYIVSNVC